MAFADVAEDAGHLRASSFFGYNELGVEQSCFHLAWQDIPGGLLPWDWAASSSGFLTTNTTGFQGSDLPTPDFRQPSNAEIPNSLLDQTSLGSVQPSFASYTVQQSSEFVYPIQETPTAKNITPNFSESYDSQGSLDSLKPSDLNRAHSALEPNKKGARGRRPRHRQPLCDTKSPRERKSQLNNASNRWYLNALERNRHAATKCRARKQNQENALATEVEILESRHQQLSSCYNVLIEQVYHLKSDILRHRDCNCALIQRYIRSEAQKLVDIPMMNTSSSNDTATIIPLGDALDGNDSQAGLMELNSLTRGYTMFSGASWLGHHSCPERKAESCGLLNRGRSIFLDE
ncbi:transcription factor atf21 [Fusarium beomiforme]|uniref:Transcription factor atf21 n=1 Tax=Fusarium beomiforme TaxID=44412 RepID=A0A9P5DTI8_9HYPO|nr:transcription factor atf21 [Fusarium beomiforme]